MDKSLRNVEGKDIQLQKAQELALKVIHNGGKLSVEGLSNAPGSQLELTKAARNERDKESEALERKLREAQIAILNSVSIEPSAQASTSTTGETGDKTSE